MANEATQTVESDLDTFHSNIRGLAVLEKLATDWNIHPRNSAQARQLLELADELGEERDKTIVKAASNDEDPFLNYALSGLRQATGRPQTPDSLFKQAASNIIQEDEVVRKAALHYVDHMLALEQQAASASK